MTKSNPVIDVRLVISGKCDNNIMTGSHYHVHQDLDKVA